jgi:hypothetical protein
VDQLQYTSCNGNFADVSCVGRRSFGDLDGKLRIMQRKGTLTLFPKTFRSNSSIYFWLASPLFGTIMSTNGNECNGIEWE